MVEAIATIHNAAGIHCRPSSLIMKAVAGYEGRIHIFNEKGETDLKSVLSLMAMELLPEDTVTIQVSGPEEEKVCRELVDLFQTDYDFAPAEEGAALSMMA